MLEVQNLIYNSISALEKDKKRTVIFIIRVDITNKKN